MHFGAKLLNARYQPWAAHYLDYAQLKALLKEDTDMWLNRLQSHLDNHNASTPTAAGEWNSCHWNNTTASTAGLSQAASRNVSNSSLSAVSMTQWSLQGLPSFITCLNEEVERILFFFLQQQAKVAAELESCRQDQAMLQRQDSSFWMSSANRPPSDSESNEEDLLYQKYSRVALHLLRLIQYVDLNMTGIRKILKKHDKLCHTHLSSLYLGKRTTLLAPLLSNDSLDALIKIFETSWQEWTLFCRERRKLLHDVKLDTVLEVQAPPSPHTTTVRMALPASTASASNDENLVSQPSMEPEPPISMTIRSASSVETTPLLRQSSPKTSPWSSQTDLQTQQPAPVSQVYTVPTTSTLQARRSPSPTTSSGVHTLPPPSSTSLLVPLVSPDEEDDHNQYLVGKSPKLVLLHIKAARSRLQETSDFVQMLAAPFLLDAGPAQEDEEEYDDETERVDTEGEEDPAKARQQRTQSISNFLNLLSTFLYMANYYIVAPASNRYAEKLGGEASQAGLIIGMTPVAALASTLLYSWWTSYSYKAALAFASICSIAGNACYAAGLPFQSWTLVLVGRLLNGFGSARSINRRYIADSYSRRHRTAASAAFVTAGSLGMSTGPAVAALLEFTVNKEPTPVLLTENDNMVEEQEDTTNLVWQVENAPGWIMFVLWTMYLIALLWLFQDPPRRRSKTTKVEIPKNEAPEEEERQRPHHDRNPVVLKIGGRPGYLAQESTTSEMTMFSVYPKIMACLSEYVAVVVIITVYFVLKLVSLGIKPNAFCVVRPYSPPCRSMPSSFGRFWKQR